MSTLNLNDIIEIAVIISPTSAVGPSFNEGLIVGPSTVIAGTTLDRMRTYSSTADITTDGFSPTSPEVLAATIYFAQTPQPAKVAIGRWNTATETALAAVQACRVANPNWYAVTCCGATDADILMIAAYVNGCTPAAVYLDTVVDTAVLAGTALAAGYETGAISSSTDISAGTATTLQVAVNLDVYAITPTYHTVTLVVTGLNTGVKIAAALQAAIQAIGPTYANVTVTFTGGVYVVTSATKGPLSRIRIVNGATNDVAAVLKLGAANGATDTDGIGSIGLALWATSNMRVLTQYSTQTVDAVAGVEGFAMGSNTQMANSAFALANQVIAEVAPEPLTETQALALQAQNVNYVANYNNTYNLFENGIMASGMWFDTVLGLDQLASQISIAVMNLLVSQKKIPYTEGGMTLLRNAIKGPCDAAVTSDFLAPGLWDGPPILTLSTGDTLSEGYLVLSAPISGQTQIQKNARISPPIYVIPSLAEAIQKVMISVQVQL